MGLLDDMVVPFFLFFGKLHTAFHHGDTNLHLVDAETLA